MEAIKLTCGKFVLCMQGELEIQLFLCAKEVFLSCLDILCAARHAKTALLPMGSSAWPLLLLATQRATLGFYVLSYVTKGQPQQAVRPAMTDGGSLVTWAVKIGPTELATPYDHQSRSVRPLSVWNTPWWDSQTGQTATHRKGRYCLTGCRT